MGIEISWDCQFQSLWKPHSGFLHSVSGEGTVRCEHHAKYLLTLGSWLASPGKKKGIMGSLTSPPSTALHTPLLGP